MKRRTFVAAVLGSLGAAIVALWSAWRPSTSPSTNVTSTARNLFPERYRATLRAMVDRLMPASQSQQFPGALELGAWDFIEGQVARVSMKGVHRLLMRGAAQADAVARTQFGMTLTQCDETQRDQVIEAMQNGAGAKGRFHPQRFVSVLLALTLEGCFSDPAHGGNRGSGGWQWLGYAMHPPRPACEGGAHCE